MKNARIQSLKEQIADLKRRWPAHSVPPAMFQELEDLEEKLQKAIEQNKKDRNAKKDSSC
jgi:hypothetical protein